MSDLDDVGPKVPFLGPRSMGAVNGLGLWTMIRKEVGRFLKAFAQTVLAPVVSTLLFFVVFAFVLGGNQEASFKAASLTFLIPGLVMMTMAQSAFMNTSGSLVLSKVQGNIVDVLMPPLSSLELTIGYMIGGMTRGLIVGALSLGCLSFFSDIHVHNIFFILYYAVAGSMMLSLIGILSGIWADKFDHMIAVHSFVVLPATFLSGTFFTLESVPADWRWLCWGNPFFYMTDGFRYGFIGSADSFLYVGLAFVLVVNLGLLGACYALFESGYKLKA